ncbi:MAG TPA: DUF4136 domain-containing protein [Vicinamibacteria bacterium]|nr:DUF4136 domain-containing protein [Vicinamibacteria bacterium]
MRNPTFVATASFLLATTAALAQSVTYDFDTSADFSRLRTYAWVSGTNVRDELNHKRIVAAIDAQLAARGLKRVEPASNPDALVAYHATFDKDLRINGFSSGWGGYRFAASRSGTATVDEIVNGTLAVDIVDAKTRSIVWRGIASREVDAKASPEKREKNIRRAAEKMFKNYPPRG